MLPDLPATYQLNVLTIRSSGCAIGAPPISKPTHAEDGEAFPLHAGHLPNGGELRRASDAAEQDALLALIGEEHVGTSRVAGVQP